MPKKDMKTVNYIMRFSIIIWVFLKKMFIYLKYNIIAELVKGYTNAQGLINDILSEEEWDKRK